ERSIDGAAYLACCFIRLLAFDHVTLQYFLRQHRLDLIDVDLYIRRDSAELATNDFQDGFAEDHRTEDKAAQRLSLRVILTQARSCHPFASEQIEIFDVLRVSRTEREKVDLQDELLVD